MKKKRLDPLDKLDMILTSVIKRKNNEKTRMAESDHPASTFIHGFEKEIDGLEWAQSFLRQIRRDEHSVSDEIVLKMYGQK